MSEVKENLQGSSDSNDKGFSLPKLSVFQLFNLCFGAIGIQFAWSMQIALSSRVLEPLGANPFLLGLIWCAGPITGILVQPIVGAISDRTWTKLGKRRPFLLVGAFLGALALLLFPFSPTLLIAAAMIWIIDACVNISQGPYRALIPDSVPSEQHAVANSYLNFAFGLGSVVSLGVAPVLNMFHISMTLSQQYIMAALAFVLFIIYTCLNVKEYKSKHQQEQTVSAEKTSIFSAFKTFVGASKEIHKVCGVQFFTWLALMSMFIYLTSFVCHSVYNLPDMSTSEYKYIDSVYSAVMPITEKTTTDNKILVSANAKLQDLNQTLEEDKADLSDVKSLINSIDNTSSLDDLANEVVIDKVKAENTKLTKANKQLDVIISGLTVKQAKYSDSDKLALENVSQTSPEIMDVVSKIDNLSELTKSNLSKINNRFSKLVNASSVVKGYIANDDVKLAPSENYKNLLDEYKKYLTLEKVIAYKNLLINFNLLKNEPQSTTMVEKSTLINFNNVERYSLLKKIDGEATFTAQLALVAFNLMALVLSIPLGYLCNKFGKKAIYTVSLAFMAVAFLFAPFVSTPNEVIVMMGAAGVAWATILSIPFAFLCDYMPEGEGGAIMGIFNMFIAAPQLVSATLVGWVISQSPVNTVFGIDYNWPISFIVASVSTFVAIGILQTVKEKRISKEAN